MVKQEILTCRRDSGQRNVKDIFGMEDFTICGVIHKKRVVGNLDLMEKVASDFLECEE